MSHINNDIAHLFDSSGNLHSEVIKNYVHNVLSSVDTHIVERHLLNSPFDSDVVEGYQTMRRNKNADYYVNQIRATIPSIVGPEKAMQINYKLIAASVVGLLGLVSIGYLVSSLDFSSQPDMTAATEEVEVVEPKPIITRITESTVVDSIVLEDVISQNESVEVLGNADEIEAVPPVSVIERIEESIELESDQIIAQTENVSSEAIEDSTTEMDVLSELIPGELTSESVEVKVKVDPSSDMIAYSKESIEEPKVSKKYASKAEQDGFTEATELRGEKSLLDEGGVRFKKKQYADAAKFYDLVLNSNPTHQSALKYGGLSNLYIGNYSKAATQLSSVSRKTDSIKWSLATAYLKTGRKESAKGILNDLEVNGSSNYKKKSKEVLATF